MCEPEAPLHVGEGPEAIPMPDDVMPDRRTRQALGFLPVMHRQLPSASLLRCTNPDEDVAARPALRSGQETHKDTVYRIPSRWSFVVSWDSLAFVLRLRKTNHRIGGKGKYARIVVGESQRGSWQERRMNTGF